VWSIWRHRESKSVCRAESCCCMFVLSRKLNLILLEHNCIPANCCYGDASRGESTAWDGERQVSEMQLRVAAGLHKPSKLLCTFLHAWQWSNSGPWGYRCAVSTSLLGTRTAHAYAHARLAGVSREPVLGVHTTLRAELPGSWHRHRRQRHYLGFVEEQESPCSS